MGAILQRPSGGVAPGWMARRLPRRGHGGGRRRALRSGDAPSPRRNRHRQRGRALPHRGGEASPIEPAGRLHRGCDPTTTRPHFRARCRAPGACSATPWARARPPTGDRPLLAGRRSLQRPGRDRRLRALLEGPALRYALVGNPRTLHRLPAIRRNLDRLRDPSTPAAQARAIIRRTPTILWIAANVHGNEPSGADAVVKLLHELSDSSDCMTRAILGHAVVGLIPVQNPDGRAHDRRYNSYAFDMNRDGLVGTQPEVSGPPPSAVEVPAAAVRRRAREQQQRLLLPAGRGPDLPRDAERAVQRGRAALRPGELPGVPGPRLEVRDLEVGDDFFAQVYGDTVPTTQMGAVGMTFEQGDAKPYSTRVTHQYTSALTTLYAGATHRAKVLREWRHTFVEAETEGRAVPPAAEPHLQPGPPAAEARSEAPGLRLLPARELAGDPRDGESAPDGGTSSWTAWRTGPSYADFRPYGDAPRRKTLPAGTYWISLAQPQKHWVQATLNEDTYVPFPYFYDVSGWSLPLLAGIPGGSTGRHLRAPVVRVPQLRKPGRAPAASGAQDRRTRPVRKNTGNGYQYSGWLKWRLAQDWRVPLPGAAAEGDHRQGAAQVRRPGGRERRLLSRCSTTSAPRAALSGWVEHGGRYVGWQEGALLASALGISQVGMLTPQTTSPGAMMRIRTPHGRNEIEWDSDYNLVLAPGTARVVGSFPKRMFVSGFGAKLKALAGTALETVEKVGSGSVTVFGYEPNFRAVADGSARPAPGGDPATHRRLRCRRRAAHDAAEKRPSDAAGPHPHPSLAAGPRRPEWLPQLQSTSRAGVSGVWRGREYDVPLEPHALLPAKV